jgi:hypothetical protein
VHAAFIDTEMAAHIPADRKISPTVIAQRALDGLAAGRNEIIVDEVSRQIKAGLAG